MMIIKLTMFTFICCNFAIVYRWTVNLGKAEIDGAVRCSDQEAVEMASYLARKEGLFVGSSSALNVVGALKTAEFLHENCADGNEKIIVTIICDSGERHLTKFHNKKFLSEHALLPEEVGLDFFKNSSERVVLTHEKGMKKGMRISKL